MSISAIEQSQHFKGGRGAWIGAALVGLWAFAAGPRAALAAEPADAEAAETDADASASTEPERNYSKEYIGAFFEYSARGGLSIATEAPYSGWNVDVGFRHSFPILLGDFRVAYRYDHLTPTDEAKSDSSDLAAILAQPGVLEQHSVGGYLGLHPGYLLLLGSNKLSYALASLHAELGFGMQYSMMEPTADQKEVGRDYRSSFGPFVSLGVGLGIPLLDPDKGSAPWLHFLYRWHVADFDGDIETFDVNMHILQIGLGWRINGLLF